MINTQATKIGQHSEQTQDNNKFLKLAAELANYGVLNFRERLFTPPDFSQIKAPIIASLDQQANPSSTLAGFTKFGELAYQQGQVAIMILAGGQGTRLGTSEPKGCFYIPELNKFILQIHFENILRSQILTAKTLPVIILTSEHTDKAIKDFLESHNFFGLISEQVTFIQQGNLPNFRDFQGTPEFLMADNDSYLVSPNGHGGFLEALSTSGTLDQLKQYGIKVLDMIQVDNILSRTYNPMLLGTMIKANFDIITRVFEKTSPSENVGNYIGLDDGHAILEYSDATQEQKEMTQDGKPILSWGSTGSHIWSIDFLIKHRDHKLPFHIAKDKQAWRFNPTTGEQEKLQVNKLELFNFDLIQLAKASCGWAVDRNSDFAAIKGKTGPDSLETAVPLFNKAKKID